MILLPENSPYLTLLFHILVRFNWESSPREDVFESFKTQFSFLFSLVLLNLSQPRLVSQTPKAFSSITTHTLAYKFTAKTYIVTSHIWCNHFSYFLLFTTYICPPDKFYHLFMKTRIWSPEVLDLCPFPWDKDRTPVSVSIPVPFFLFWSLMRKFY